MDGTIRKNIQVGMLVDIVLKADQPTGKLTRGYVARILTKSPTHHRGIKVELANGKGIGRVQNIPSKEDIRLENFKFYNKFFFSDKIYSIWDSERETYLVIDYINGKGVTEKTSFLFETHEQARSFLNGTKYDSKLYPVREINRRKPIADNFSKIGTEFLRINKERKLSMDKLREWENYFKNMR